MTVRRALGVETILLGLFLSSAALAEDPKVEVNAQIILASNEGQGVEPATLAPMKDKFRKEGFSFTSFKELKSQKLVLVKNHPSEVRLPNNKVATLTLEDVVAGAARIHVRLAPNDVSYTLGREGSVFIEGGHHLNGTLVLVLSPVEAARHPRLFGGVLRPWRNGHLTHAYP